MKKKIVAEFETLIGSCHVSVDPHGSGLSGRLARAERALLNLLPHKTYSHLARIVMPVP